MQLRAIIAVIIAFAALVVGGVLVLNYEAASAQDFLDVFLRRAPDAPVFASIAAWASAAFALLTLIAALIFFWVDEDEEMPRRGGVGVVFILIAVSLVFFWVALQKRAVEAAPPPEPAPAVEPAPAPLPEAAPPAPEPEQAPPAPERLTRAFDWDYMIPLIEDSGYHQTPAMAQKLADLFPMTDTDATVRAMLCGKAWVAFSGATSEEGPRPRNERRARIRAELVLEAADAWLDAHTGDCARPILLGIDLGQHEETGAGSPTGALTGYQRQTLIVARDRVSPDEEVSAADADAELSAFLDDPASLKAFLAGRHYTRPAAVFVPAAQY